MAYGEPSPRRTDTRNKRSTRNIIPLDLVDLYSHFNSAIQSIHRQFDLAKKMAGNKNGDQAEHIWRSLVVFLVSALDYYMHGLTGYGLRRIYKGEGSAWTESEKYKDLNLNINIELLKTVEHSDEDDEDDWLLSLVFYNYELKSLVSFKSVAGQLDLLDIDVRQVAAEAFPEFTGKGKDENDKYNRCLQKMKDRLGKLYGKRNVIAHQAGRAYDTAQLEKVTADDVEEFISDVEKIVGAINILAGRKE